MTILLRSAFGLAGMFAFIIYRGCLAAVGRHPDQLAARGGEVERFELGGGPVGPEVVVDPRTWPGCGGGGWRVVVDDPATGEAVAVDVATGRYDGRAHGAGAFIQE